MHRILIVDDDEATRDLIKSRLEQTYEIALTGDARSVLTTTFEFKPDAILLDLSMPELSGFEVCKTLSSLGATKSIPVFIMSGGDIRNRAFCRTLGATEYFQKSLDFIQLKARLAYALEPKVLGKRAEVRVNLKLVLKLKMTRPDGTHWEARAINDNVSASGFLCSCPTSLSVGDIVDVFVCSGDENFMGMARAVRVEPTDTATARYGFQFINKQAFAFLAPKNSAA
jgi:CheY-like chemotaxis protein